MRKFWNMALPFSKVAYAVKVYYIQSNTRSNIRSNIRSNTRSNRVLLGCSYISII